MSLACAEVTTYQGPSQGGSSRRFVVCIEAVGSMASSQRFKGFDRPRLRSPRSDRPQTRFSLLFWWRSSMAQGINVRACSTILRVGVGVVGDGVSCTQRTRKVSSRAGVV